MSHWNSHMPVAIPRAHFEPPWKGDRPAAILAASRKASRAGYPPAIDMNFQWAGGVAWNIHWTTPIRNNYRYLKVGAKVRKMTWRELRRPISKWGRDVGNWRRQANVHSARPCSYAYLVRYAKHHHVTLIAELKSPAFAFPAAATYLVEAAKEADHPAWFMSLYNMKNVRGKAKAIYDAGGQFAVIFGNMSRLRMRRPPKDWLVWGKYVTQVWGRNWGHK